MKFLCENCKAKYQIADDKVAGRTVRMKCRKCGYMIEVEASVTETSVAAKMPPDESPRGGASTGVSASKGAVQAAASGLSPPRPPPRRGPSGPPAKPGSLPPPTAGRPVAPKTVPRPAGPATAGLAGAFSKSVTSTQEDPSSVSAAMAVLSSSSSTEEWYVGINGVPVGPVRLSELRRKAASGAIGEESLVWREGFEEWLPLRTFPELVAMLRESTGLNRAALTPTPGPVGSPATRPLSPPGTRALSSPLGGAARQAPPPRGGLAATARSNVVAIASRRATAEKIDGLGETAIEDDIEFDGEASPQAVAASPAAAGTPAPESRADAHAEDEHAGLGSRLAESRRAHPAAWLVVGLGGMFLGVAVMVLLLPKGNSKQPAVQIVSVMIPTPAPPATDTEGLTTIGPIEVNAAVSSKTPSGGGKGSKASEPAAPAAPLSTSLTGLGGLVGGPVSPSGGSSPRASGGGQLAAVDVERVVQSHRAFVKRQCWESALANKAPSAPTSARVVVNMNVATDGRVSSATASGGDGYPGLAGCVQNQVKTWAFPPSDGSSVTVPFVFAAQ